MYCVVQIGSRMLRFECGTTRRTLSWAFTQEKKTASASAARTLRPMRKSPRSETTRGRLTGHGTHRNRRLPVREDRLELIREPLRLPLAFFASGAAALLFQVLWFRALGRVVGNTVWAGTLVLTAFMLGMAIGGLLAARWTQRIRNPVRAFALAEITVGLTGSLLVWSLPLLEPVVGQWLAPLTGHPTATASARL